MSESWQHKQLKAKARQWLQSQGCREIRDEFTWFNGGCRIDVVGFKEDKPVLGIECGTLNGTLYHRLPFPCFHMAFFQAGDAPHKLGECPACRGSAGSRLWKYRVHAQLLTDNLHEKDKCPYCNDKICKWFSIGYFTVRK